MTNDKQRLVELLQKANREAWNLINMSCCEERLKLLDKVNEIRADYLLEHGVIVPPCKVGDEINGEVVCEIIYFETLGLEGNINRSKWIYTSDKSDTEKKIYATHLMTWEKAEQALNNIQNGNSCEGGAQG